METALAVLLFILPPALTVWFMARRTGASSPQATFASKAADNRFGTLFCNAFRLRCPVCKQGKIFKGWFGIEDQCPACGIELAKETGYYIGSIYFNYGLTGVIEIASYMSLRFGVGVPDRYLIPPLAAFAVIFPLFFFRYARASWLVFDQYFQPRSPPTNGIENPAVNPTA